ncbi:rubisco accumulation factor 1.1, chloroplastic-like [Selaginella moellendorffii]|uniref:rubisco accumulation factor 1.1, chloroplastic-like n=1 Tax=Selaginella moellendorffii TaxID=88036 RepID=UPI000D1C3749|nr:rubisco accumulation factor 1.1, chloroplastic-like [Selaginella moellendorffii]|eukprot:XP_024536106.1 rubisco accumulation factor 1.1, chloroplastic-like [Selaginella moellendorffii]
MAGNAGMEIHALGCCSFRIPVSPVANIHSAAPSIRRGARFACGSSLRDRLLLSNTPGGRDAFYQPFRPPPGVLESVVSPEQQLEIVRERRGQWHDYGKHIPGLMRSGYTPASLDEATGLTGVEQNQIVVACQVRDTLISTGMDAKSLEFFDFDVGGAAILYELRILSAPQRRVAAEYVIERAMGDSKAARDVARALKDFERRKREFGREFFSSDPGDCLAFWWYRQSKELKDGEREDALRKALEFATSKSARSLLSSSLGEKDPVEKQALAGKEEKPAKMVSVVRLEYGETAGLVMLPVADPDASSIKAAPSGGALGEGAFRIHRSSTAWRGWVPLPGWKPVLAAVSPITILFPDARELRLQRKKSDDPSEELLLLVDKGTVSEIKAGSIYLVASGGGGLSLESGKDLHEGLEVLGEVLLALSPPGGSDEQEDETQEDWD